MELWIATTNPGKLNEFKILLNKYPFDIHVPNELPYYHAPKEDGKTFEDNARLKARSLHVIKDKSWVIGEDTGLEVSGLNNAPGIFSARYAGDHASPAENRAKLLKMIKLRCPQKREARFYTVIIAYSPDNKEYVYTGELKGHIAQVEKGTGGFGYDNIFIPEGEDKTLAELDFAHKNKISHRAKAINAFLEEHHHLFV